MYGAKFWSVWYQATCYVSFQYQLYSNMDEACVLGPHVSCDKC
jgi:hypothetical protein